MSGSHLSCSMWHKMKQVEVDNSIKRKACLVYAGMIIKHMRRHGKDELMCICVAECVCVYMCV